jgi:hypothetical protein
LGKEGGRQKSPETLEERMRMAFGNGVDDDEDDDDDAWEGKNWNALWWSNWGGEEEWACWEWWLGRCSSSFSISI